jgi:hypothetical protein
MICRARVEVLTRSHDEAMRELHDALGALGRDFVAPQAEEDGDHGFEHHVTNVNVARKARRSDGVVRYHGRAIGVWRTNQFDERGLDEGLTEDSGASAWPTKVEVDLATFNRARHDERDGLLREVWLRGEVEMGGDCPTEAYGVVSIPSDEGCELYTPGGGLMEAPPPGGDDFPPQPKVLFEYVQEIKRGETVEEVVEAVFEKVNLWADGCIARTGMMKSAAEFVMRQNG